MKTIVRNTIFMNLFNVFGRASGFLRYAVLVYFLSDPDYALITFGFSFGRMCRHFMDGGLDNLITRDGARSPEKIPSFLLNSFILKAILGALFFIAAYFYLYGARGLSPRELAVVYVSMIGSGMTSMTGVMRSGFSAIERMEYIFYTNTPSRMISIAALLAVLYFKLSLIWAAWAVALEPIIWLGAMAYCSVGRFSLRRASASWGAIVYMISESWALAVFGFFNIFYLSLDVIMIEYLMGGREAVAPYTLASLFMEGVSLLLTGYIFAVFPVFSRYYPRDEDAFRRLFRQSCVIMTAAAAPVSALLFFWADGWMNFIRETGPVSSQVMSILAINTVLSMLNTLLVVVFTARDRQRWLVAFTGLAVTVSFTTNWVMIPIYQQPGGAIATLISQALLFMVMAFSCRRLFGLTPPFARMGGLLAVSFAAGAAVKCLPVPLLAVPFCYAAALTPIAHFTGVFTLNDARRFQTMLKA
ncbi:MAG: oligosaccharide flippase family protein [bacterium]|nr:oligosaccharide flippase family protein [bacterium]